MRLLISAVSFLLAGAASAETYAAHEHGKANMNIALSGDVLNVELLAPAHSFWGFEYAAKTPEEKNAHQKALAALKSANWLSLPAGADCQLKTSDVASSSEQSVDKDHAAHKDHGHKHHHHDKSQEGKHDSMHEDIAVNLEYACSKPSALVQERAISTSLFQIFPNIESVNLQAVTDLGQQAKSLSAKDSVFSLKQTR